MNIYSRDDIIDIRKSASHYKLDAPSQFWWADEDRLVSICNGCGPDKWGLDARVFATNVLSRYAAAFAIHDVQYVCQSGTREDADTTLKNNMIKIWKKDFGVWRWISIGGRFARRIVIPGVYLAVATKGDAAWEAAGRKYNHETLLEHADSVSDSSDADRMPSERN